MLLLCSIINVARIIRDVGTKVLWDPPKLRPVEESHLELSKCHGISNNPVQSGSVFGGSVVVAAQEIKKAVWPLLFV